MGRDDRLNEASFLTNRTIASFTELTDEEERTIREVLEAMKDFVAAAEGGSATPPVGAVADTEVTTSEAAAPTPMKAALTRARKSAGNWKASKDLVVNIRARAVESGRYVASTDIVTLDAAHAIEGETRVSPQQIADSYYSAEIVAWLEENKQPPRYVDDPNDPSALPFNAAPRRH